MGIRYGYRSRHGVGARPGISPGFSLLVLALVAGAVVPATRTAALIALAALALIGVGSFLVALSPGASLVVLTLVVGAMVPATRTAALIALAVLALAGVGSLFLRLAETLGSDRLALATRALVALLPVALVVWGGLADGEWLWEVLVILGLGWLGTDQLIDWGAALGWRARRAYRAAARRGAAPTGASALPPEALLEGGHAGAGEAAGRASGAARQTEVAGTVLRAPRRRDVDDILAELDSKPGLERVAEQLRELVAWVAADRQRRVAGMAGGELGLHLVFLGSPGTGKTMVARLVGEIYAALGLLERGHLIETDRSGLVGDHLGRTSGKTHEQIDRAQGGVLFVDEAYALVDREQRDSFGAEAIAALVKRMDDDAAKWACVLAGYTDEMQRMLDSNPGLRSRVSTTIEFADYDPAELMAIADSMVEQREYELGDGAREALEQGLRELYVRRERGWANAREVCKLIDHVTRAQAVRLHRDGGANKAAANELRTLRLADVVVALERRRAQRREGDGDPPFDSSDG